MDDGPDNVLFVVLDTVRKDRLTPYGCDRETTPQLDAFAEEAAVFDEAVAPAPWTLPVHASMFTGEYPSEHGADQQTPYLEETTTLAQSLSAAGHSTACFSSNAWITPYTRLTAGFDQQDNFFQAMPGDVLSGTLADAWQYLNDSSRLRTVADKLVSLGNVAHEMFASSGAASKTPAVLEQTRSFIEDADSGAIGGSHRDIDGATDDDIPGWFAFVNLMDAHLPYHPPDEYAAAFAADVDSESVCQNSKEYNCGARAIDDDEWDDIERLYDAEIAHMDAQLGSLFGWLRETDRWDDTAVIVCADHGELHGGHDLFGHEFGLYEQLVNVPLIIKHPDLESGRQTGLVELVDLYHTILDMLDVSPGETDVGPTARARDPTRSVLSDEYRQFGDVVAPDPGQAAIQTLADVDPTSDGQSSETAPKVDASYAFIEYTQPVVELNQLEEKARAADIGLDERSRFYSRMRAGRRPNAKYIRRDRVADEGFRLDEDPDELDSRARQFADGSGSADRHGASESKRPDAPQDEIALSGIDDPLVSAERALSAFERQVGGAWTDPAGSTGDDPDSIAQMDQATQDRLRDLGYLE